MIICRLGKGNFRRFLVLFPMLAFLGWLAGGGVLPADGAPAEKGKFRPADTPAKEEKSQASPEGKQLPGFGKYRVVRIDPDGVFPQNLEIQPGTTVIWYNATDSYSSVVFNEGANLNRSTRSPTLFFLAPDGTYVSAAFASGGTASTAFVKAGNYRYFVTGLPVSGGTAFARVMVK